MAPNAASAVGVPWHDRPRSPQARG